MVVLFNNNRFIAIITEIDCGPPPPLSNGNISFTNGTKYESIATYMCNSEHELLGVSQRKCGLDGMWTGIEPSCVPEGGYTMHVQMYVITIGIVGTKVYTTGSFYIFFIKIL